MRVWILVLLIGFCVSGAGYAQEGGQGKMKKIVMVIASDGFRDEELLVVKDILQKKGIGVEVASTDLTEAKGTLGAKVKPDILLNDINARDYAALIFVGGQGASVYWDNPIAHQLIETALNNNRVVAAICIAPVTLARAGILTGKRATVFNSEVSELQEAGADYTGRPVEKDGNIITASGPAASAEFANVIIQALNK